jgi:hypothetical protein
MLPWETMAKTLVILYALVAFAAGAAMAFACSSSNGGNGSGGDAGSGVYFSCDIAGSLCTQVLAPASAMSGEQNACKMQPGGVFMTGQCPTAGSLGCCVDKTGVEKQCVYDVQDQMVDQPLCVMQGKTWIPSEAGTSIAAMAFVGTWARSGTQTVTCPMGPPTMNPISGDLVIVLGQTNDTIVGSQPDGCITVYSVSGNVATAMAGQSCNVTTEGGVAETITVDSRTLTLSADGKSMMSMGTSTIDKTATGTMCMARASGTYTKR